MTVGKAVLQVALTLLPAATAAQTTSLPSAPLINSYPVLDSGILTHVYDYEWFSGGASLDLGSDTIGICDYDGGQLCITSARLVNSTLPKSYDSRFAVKVTLARVSPTGDVTTVKSNFTYCSGCGHIARETPTITLNGSEDETADVTYGDKLDHSTNARIEEAGNPIIIIAGGTEAFLDGGGEPLDRDSIVSAGRHTLRVVSKQIGNNVFSPSKGKVRVGFAQAEKTFTLTVAPLRLTFSEPLTIAPRPADGTARLGKLTLPRPDNTPDGGSDPLVAIAEIDSTDVRPEAGQYAVRYRLATRSANYSVDEAAWHATTFTITASGDTTATPAEPSRPALPSPDTDPDFFGRPLISHGSPLGDESLTRVYDPDWYAKGGEVEMARPPALARWGEGTIVITGAFIGHAASGGEVRYPASYDEPLPVFVSLGFVDDGGDTTDIEGRHVYCDACGGVRRDTPEISVAGVATEGDGVATTYGEPLLCRTSARLTRVVNGQTVIVAGGVDITMDGGMAYNGDLPAAGTHELRVVSKRLGNDNLDPARGQVEVGFAQAEKTFTLTVAPLRLTFSEPLTIAPRPADGTARLGKITLPRPDNAPDGGSDPLVALAEIDSADVRPEAGEYAVRYRLATRSADYTTDEAAWHATTFTITASGDTTTTPAEPPRPALPSPDTDPDFFGRPLISHGSPLGDESLTRVYDPDWYAMGGEVKLERPPALARWGEGTIVITGAFIGHAASGGEVRYPASYEEPLPVFVSLGFADDGGDTTDIEGRHVYCDACGGVRRDTPEISVDGVATDGGVATTYGEPLLCRTSARLTRVVNGQTVIVAGEVDITMDGEVAYNGDLPAAGTHELRVVSKRLGNDNLDPARGQVEVGFAQAEKTFTLTVAPLRLTFSEPLTIAPRPADGTTRLGKLTLPRPDNTPDGGQDPKVEIAEIDSTDVRPEAGEYAVRYRLATRSANYTTDEAAWHATTFTITASGDTTTTPAEPPRPTLPSPDTDPDFFGRPLISHGSPLGDEGLTRVYDPDWYAKGGEVKLERPPALARWGEGTIVITGAFIGHAASGDEGGEVHYPASYDEPLPVFVSLGFADGSGDTTDIEGRHVYCDACGGVRRDTPEISVDGVATDGGVATTYGEPLLCRTSARLTRIVNGQTVIVAGGVDITMDGEVAYNGDLPAAGTHELRVVSKRLGNDNLDPARGQVEVGFAQAEKTFTLTVAPLRLTFSEPLTIAPRPADGTARLGKITLPRPDNAPDGGEDPLVALAEIDSTDVRPEAGQYAVRYRLTTRSANYTVDETAWHATTFTITGRDTTATPAEPSRPALPSPDTDPDFFSRPLISHGSPLGDESLTRIYDPDWYAKGGEVELERPPALARRGEGTVTVTGAFIGHAASGVEGGAVRYPTSYDEPLPVYVSLGFVDADGDTTDIEGRHLYCDGCGSVRRNKPEVSVDGAATEGGVEITYGEPLLCRTSARLTRTVNGQTVIVAGGVDITMDGEMAYNGDLPTAGTHELRVISKRLGNDNLDPARGDVEVGFAQAERAFTLTVAPLRLTFSEPLTIAPRPADGTMRLGKITLPRPDNAPDGGEDPLIAIAEIDSAEVRPEAGQYAVRYRLATRSANYTVDEAAWHATTFTITEGEAGACAKGIVRLKFGNTLVADNAGGEYAVYQWLADGKEIGGAIKQYYHANPLPEAAYSVRLTRKDGTTLSSCPLNVGGTQTGLGIRAEGDGLDTVIEVTEADAEGALVVAYTSGGMMVGRARTGRNGAVRMRLPKGIVILRAESGGRRAEMSIACH